MFNEIQSFSIDLLSSFEMLCTPSKHQLPKAQGGSCVSTKSQYGEGLGKSSLIKGNNTDGNQVLGVVAERGYGFRRF
jgi:hypothetical protein